MRLLLGLVVACALVALSATLPVSVVTTTAHAGKMNGKPYGAHAPTAAAACFNGACRKPRKK